MGTQRVCGMEVTHWGPGAKCQQEVWGQVHQKLVIFCK